MTDDFKQRLLELLRHKAYIRGSFKLASGRQSNHYVDAKTVTLSPEGAYLTSKILLDEIVKHRIDAMGGLAIGADPILGALAAISYSENKPISTFIVRKEPKHHGKEGSIEGPLPQGRVAIIDDVTTTGASILKAIKAVEKNSECQIVMVITLVDRLEGARENLKAEGYDLISIFTLDDLTNCPQGS